MVATLDPTDHYRLDRDDYDSLLFATRIDALRAFRQYVAVHETAGQLWHVNSQGTDRIAFFPGLLDDNPFR